MSNELLLFSEKAGLLCKDICGNGKKLFVLNGHWNGTLQENTLTVDKYPETKIHDVL